MGVYEQFLSKLSCKVVENILVRVCGLAVQDYIWFNMQKDCNEMRSTRPDRERWRDDCVVMDVGGVTVKQLCFRLSVCKNT